VDATEHLLATLRASATDLARLIGVYERRRSPTVYVRREARARWQARAPAAWAMAQAWLAEHGVTIVAI
jgi:hypothetical protein